MSKVKETSYIRLHRRRKKKKGKRREGENETDKSQKKKEEKRKEKKSKNVGTNFSKMIFSHFLPHFGEITFGGPKEKILGPY